MKKEKGITLVSLVITIIVIFILAAAAITIVFSAKEVSEKATEAGKSWNEAQIKEHNDILYAFNILNNN